MIEGVEWHLFVPALAVSIIAAAFDARTGQIPNPICVAAALLGLAMGLASKGVSGLMASLMGGIACAIVPVGLYRFKAMGGGDVKLLAALGAILGVEYGLEMETMSFVVGAIQGLFIWKRQGLLVSGLRVTLGFFVPLGMKRLQPRENSRLAAATSFRFGPAMAVGCALAVATRIFV